MHRLVMLTDLLHQREATELLYDKLASLCRLNALHRSTPERHMLALANLAVKSAWPAVGCSPHRQCAHLLVHGALQPQPGRLVPA